MTNYSNKILIISDSDELEFNGIGKVGKTDVLNYKYTKSETKLGMLLPMPVEQLEKMIENNIAKVIN